MSMTREEAIKILENFPIDTRRTGCLEAREALKVAISALRPITREQVEKMRGEWIDIDGEKVPVDKYGQPFGWAKCSACGEYLTASDEYPCMGVFCPACGAPMTDEAVEILAKRLEDVLHENRD